MNSIDSNDTAPFLVEIVGVAGSGKTTLTRSLPRAGQPFRTVEPLRLRDRHHRKTAVRAIPGLSMMLLANPLTAMRLGWTEFKLLLYLERWDRLIRGDPSLGGRIAVVDQGPVYALARLETGERPFTGNRVLTGWLRRVVERWACAIDLIIWLDAADDALRARIVGRDQKHDVKDRSDVEIRAFLQGYRDAYERVTAQLSQAGGPDVIRFDTTTTGAAQLGERVAELLVAQHGGHEAEWLGGWLD